MHRIAFAVGSIPADIILMVHHFPPAVNDAHGWHAAMHAQLKALGYHVKRNEARFIDGHQRAIDLVARDQGITIAIELDRATPRRRSIAKVKSYGHGLVLLREPGRHH
jgi:hypothetical protein